MTGERQASALLQGFFGCLWQQQRQHRDAFIEQLHGFVGRSLTSYGPFLGLAMVDAPGFLGELRTHVFCSGQDLARQRQPSRLQIHP